MLLNQISIVPLLFLYFTSEAYSSEIKTVRFNKNFDTKSNWQLVHDHSHSRFQRDPSWTYASCHYDPKYETSVQCSIVFETNKVDGRVYKEICQITLENPKITRNNTTNEFKFDVNRYLRVFQFGKQKSIVVWHDWNDDVHFYIILFPTCRIDENSITLDGKQFDLNNTNTDADDVKVLAYWDDDNYDVIYKNGTSDNSSWNQITFDKYGYVVEGPIPLSIQVLGDFSYMTLGKVIEVDRNLDMGGHTMIMSGFMVGPAKFVVQLGKNDTETNLMLILLDGDEGAVSVAHGILGSCEYNADGKNIECSQYDRRENLIFSNNFPVYYGSARIKIWMHNLPKGGFLFFERLYCNVTLLCDHNYIEKLYVTKFDSNGHRYRTLQIMDYSGEFALDAKRDGLFENGPDEFCLYELLGSWSVYDDSKEIRVVKLFYCLRGKKKVFIVGFNFWFGEMMFNFF